MITEFATGRRFCPKCATPEELELPVVETAIKITEHEAAGTLDRYPSAERLADLAGKP